MADGNQERPVALRANQSAGFTHQRQIPAEVTAIRQIVGEFTQGEDRRAAQVNRHGDFSPRTYSGGDSDRLGRPRAGARVAADDEKHAGDHESHYPVAERRSVETYETVSAGNQIAQETQAAECGL